MLIRSTDMLVTASLDTKECAAELVSTQFWTSLAGFT